MEGVKCASCFMGFDNCMEYPPPPTPKKKTPHEQPFKQNSVCIDYSLKLNASLVNQPETAGRPIVEYIQYTLSNKFITVISTNVN